MDVPGWVTPWTKNPLPLSAPTMRVETRQEAQAALPPLWGSWHSSGPRRQALPGRRRTREGQVHTGSGWCSHGGGSGQRDNPGGQLQRPRAPRTVWREAFQVTVPSPYKWPWKHYQDRGFLGGLKSPEKPVSTNSPNTRLGDPAPPGSVGCGGLSVVPPIPRGGGTCLGPQRCDLVCEGLPGMRHTHLKCHEAGSLSVSPPDPAGVLDEFGMRKSVKTNTYPPSWRRQWHPTPVLLPEKSHGWSSLVGCSPWGHQESDTPERLPFHFSLSCIGEGNGNPLQYSCLENHMDKEAWWATVHGVAQSHTRLKQLSMHTCIRHQLRVKPMQGLAFLFLRLSDVDYFLSLIEFVTTMLLF